MNSLDYLNSIYKPYKYTKNNSVTIIDTTSGKFVVKKQNKDLYPLFNYFETRGFSNFPKIINNYRNEENIFEYVDEIFLPKEQKIEEFAKIIASYHNKTVYHKQITLDDLKNVKENINDNLDYLKNYYSNMFLNNLKQEYMSPSKYLFCRNYSQIIRTINFCEEHIDKYYELMKEKLSTRVCINHTNLSLKHFIYNGNNPVIISWDNYKIDTPVLDIVNLYNNETFEYNIFIKKYFDIFPFTETELELFFTLISIPQIIDITDDEMENVKKTKNLFKMLSESEKLIRPYNSEQKEEQ